MAFTVDVLCAALPIWLTLPVVIIFAVSGEDGEFVAQMVFSANAALALLFYQLLMLTQELRSRPTPGRRLMNLALAFEQPTRGRRVLLRRAASTAWLLGCIITGLWPLLALPALWAVADKDLRSLWDALAGTRIVHAPKPDETPVTEPAHT